MSTNPGTKSSRLLVGTLLIGMAALLALQGPSFAKGVPVVARAAIVDREPPFKLLPVKLSHSRVQPR